MFSTTAFVFIDLVILYFDSQEKHMEVIRDKICGNCGCLAMIASMFLDDHELLMGLNCKEYAKR